MKFEDALKEITQVMDSLRSRGIEVKPLEEAIKNLEQYVGHINQVEDASEAIRVEILSPIKAEMEAGSIISRRSNVIGVGGAVLGFLGIVLSVYFSYASSEDLARLEGRFSGISAELESDETEYLLAIPPEIDARLSRIEAAVSPATYYSVQPGNFIVDYGDIAELPTLGAGSIGVRYLGLIEISSNSTICTRLQIFADGVQFGDRAFLSGETIKILASNPIESGQILGMELRRRVSTDRVLVCQGETLIVFDTILEIKQIESTDAGGRERGDNVSRITFQVSTVDRSSKPAAAVQE